MPLEWAATFLSPIVLNGRRLAGICVTIMLGVAAFMVRGSAWASVTDACPAVQRPNFLVVVFDDLGFSDIGAFGGEISTPNLDRLAARSTRLTNMHVAPTCSPTRAMLLTGQDPHTVGLGAMAEVPQPGPRPEGYEGYLGQVATLAGRLRDAGYSTMMTGKWHLGAEPGQWPESHGFDRSFVLHQGGANHFGLDQIGPWSTTGFVPTYSLDGARAQMPIGVYAGDEFTNRMLQYLREQEASGKPFFAYLALTEPHWPLQAPADLTAKYRGRYDDGPVALRDRRLKAMKRKGLVAGDIQPAPMSGPEWTSLSRQERDRAAHEMEIYAAMVERADANLGRVIEELGREGRLNNTVILFISDNGAEGSSWQDVRQILTFLHTPDSLLAAQEAINRNPARMGGGDSFLVYGPQWAQAAMAPFRLYKGFTTEGGIRAPALVAGPGFRRGTTSNAMVSVRDVFPTFLSLAGEKTAPDIREGGGRSLVPLLCGFADQVRTPEDVLVTEFDGRRVVLRNDGWAAIYSDPNSLGMTNKGLAHWQLYDLRRDPSQTIDLALAQPVVLEELIAVWDRYAAANNIRFASGR